MLPTRIEQLKNDILRDIPVAKDEVKNRLRELPFPFIMLVYVNYARRFITARPRKISYSPSFWSKITSTEVRDKIHALRDEIEQGHDLTPRLSPKLRSQGFSLASIKTDENGKFIGHKWSDKDFALTAYNLHHLHLMKANSSGKFSGNSDNIIFIKFTRDEAVMVLLGNHKSFYSEELYKSSLELSPNWLGPASKFIGKPHEGSGYTPEQSIELMRAGISPLIIEGDGGVSMRSPLSLYGSSVECNQEAELILKNLGDYDTLIEDREWLHASFENKDISLPQNLDFKWTLQGTNLLLVDRDFYYAIRFYEGNQGYVIQPPL